MQDYRKLIVWQNSHQLVLDVFADPAKHLRHPDAWPVRDQMRLAAMSIPSNIADRPRQRSGLSGFSIPFVGIDQRS